tara:strand:- start:145 stop:555 length:411 start_codon:yes stop_codon:yes gene_type:complete
MSTLKVNTIQDTSGGNSSTAEQIAQGTCKAWVNFSGIGTPSIRQSFNVSSISDNATGEFTVNFSNAVPVADFSCFVTHSFGSAEKGGNSDPNFINGIGTIRRENGNTTTTALKIVTGHNFGESTQDGAQTCVGVFC